MTVRKLVATTLLGVTLAAGCGTGGQEAGATAAADRFVSSLDSPRTACRLLAPATISSLESAGEPCAEALPDLRLPEGRARDATVWAERALVRTSSDTLFLVELDNGWRVTAAGCVPAEDVFYECVVS
jgi:hypothetical protein